MDISPARVLIIATRQIGDVLCTTPLMRRARQLWPNAVIDVLGYENTMGMLAGNPDIDEVIESSEHPNWPEYRALLGRIFRKYDLAIVTQPSDRAHIYGLLAAPRRVGIVPAEAAHNWWKKLLCAHTVTLDYWRQHVVIERLRLLDIFQSGRDLSEVRPEISLVPPAAEELPLDTRAFIDGGPTVVVHATPRWRFKRWPEGHWAQLVGCLLEAERRVVLTGSADAQDLDMNQRILDRTHSLYPDVDRDRILNATGLLTLGQTARLLQLSECFVGVDTSVTHLAAAVGTKTIALFGATPPTNFGPWPTETRVDAVDRSPWGLRGEQNPEGARILARGNVRIVQGPGDCVPCRKAGCLNRFESHSDCLDGLSSGAVVAALQL